MDELINKAKQGDVVALAELFGKHRKQLRKMLELRMDRRLRGRFDPSDVLQEAFIDLAQKLPDYNKRDNLPFYLWLRLVTGERLLLFHRTHLNTAKRDVRQEVALDRKSVPHAASQSIAAALLDNYTSVSSRAIRIEKLTKLQHVLNDMDEIDREIIVLRNFEEMSNVDAAQVLGLSQNGASNRYIRALKRLSKAMKDLPEFKE